MPTNLSINKKPLFLIAATLLWPIAAGAWEPMPKPFYPEFVPLSAGETWHATTLAGEPQCVELNIPTPGLLTLEARVPPTGASNPHLIAVGDLPLAATIERQVSHLTVLASPGNPRFCVGAQDPRVALAELKIVTAFVALTPGKDGNPDDDGGNGEDPREIEVEPEGLRVAPCAFGFNKDNPDDEGGNGEDPREIEVEPEGLVAETCAFTQARAEMCRRLDASAGQDDHGDTFLCATPVARGRGLVGELRNPWGDDRDVFELTVTEIATLQIGTGGNTDTFGSLFTEQGYRLAASDDGGKDENFRLVKTLLPGRYFVHVESARRDEGAYRLHIDALP